MKKLTYILAIAFLFIRISVVSAQVETKDKLGLPGDNLNLYAVLNLFQNSATLEEFERELNNPEKVINNLDLNNDNKVDYIKVFDFAQNDVHNIVLRVDISKDEEQDVAVLITEKQSDGSVMVQLIGDEMLYGKDYIIEPHYAETPNPAYTGNNQQYAQTDYNSDNAVSTTYYEVAQWPSVVYIYSPSYNPWISSWYWGYYPSYWSSWSPHYWHYYYGYQYNYYPHYYAYYRPWYSYRSNAYRSQYYGRVRRHSNVVASSVRVNRYNSTYSRPETIDAGKRRSAQRVSDTPNGRRSAESVNSRIQTRSQDNASRQNVRIDRSVRANSGSVSRTTREANANRQGSVSGRESVNSGSRSQSVNRGSSSSTRSEGRNVERPRNTSSQQGSVGSTRSTSGQRSQGVRNSNLRSTQSSRSSTGVKQSRTSTSRPATTTKSTKTSRPASTSSSRSSGSTKSSVSRSSSGSSSRSTGSSSSSSSSRSTTSSGRKR